MGSSVPCGAMRKGLALLVLVIVVGCGGGSSQRRVPAATIDALGPTQRAGQLVVLRFTGTSAPPYVLRALRERRVAGVILFGDNIVSPRQLRSMTGALQRAARGRALVMADQEGGIVRRLSWAHPRAGQPAMGTAAAARSAARLAARDLRAAGVNVDLAPVADVAAPTRGSFMAERAFPGGATQVARLTAASVRGFH